MGSREEEIHRSKTNWGNGKVDDGNVKILVNDRIKSWGKDTYSDNVNKVSFVLWKM